MKNPKYTSRFCFAARKLDLTDEKKNELVAKYESAASLDEVRQFLPEIDESNIGYAFCISAGAYALLTIIF